mmetsp:Transcript_17519/g.40287  ORF Transcript_17519/g.40287 Transcript_17519/m.40287 type:complete len:328 (+) Transcript_17519:553-1536(+)
MRLRPRHPGLRRGGHVDRPGCPPRPRGPPGLARDGRLGLLQAAPLGVCRSGRRHEPDLLPAKRRRVLPRIPGPGGPAFRRQAGDGGLVRPPLLPLALPQAREQRLRPSALHRLQGRFGRRGGLPGRDQRRRGSGAQQGGPARGRDRLSRGRETREPPFTLCHRQARVRGVARGSGTGRGPAKGGRGQVQGQDGPQLAGVHRGGEHVHGRRLRQLALPRLPRRDHRARGTANRPLLVRLGFGGDALLYCRKVPGELTIQPRENQGDCEARGTVAGSKAGDGRRVHRCHGTPRRQVRHLRVRAHGPRRERGARELLPGRHQRKTPPGLR